MSSKADTNSHIDENDTLEKIQLIDSNKPSGKFIYRLDHVDSCCSNVAANNRGTCWSVGHIRFVLFYFCATHYRQHLTRQHFNSLHFHFVVAQNPNRKVDPAGCEVAVVNCV